MLGAGGQGAASVGAATSVAENSATSPAGS